MGESNNGVLIKAAERGAYIPSDCSFMLTVNLHFVCLEAPSSVSRGDGRYWRGVPPSTHSTAGGWFTCPSLR